jgi:hypothetical protein
VSASRQQPSAGVAAALAACEIPLSRRGPARRARLSGPERELYFWILRRFATSGRPGSAETRERAAQLGLEIEGAFATLEREDLVHRGPDGEITVAYPFSGRPTAHRVRFPDGHDAYAMCAIDALGIAAMFEQPVEIRSRDPHSDGTFRATVVPDGEATWEPATAVVVAGALAQGADSCSACCPVLNFFASEESAGGWLAEHPHVRGHVITVVDAIACGRAVFGAVFER